MLALKFAITLKTQLKISEIKLHTLKWTALYTPLPLPCFFFFIIIFPIFVYYVKHKLAFQLDLHVN